MIQVNEEFLKLPQSYLFSEVAARVRDFRASFPEADVISLGIGDVTRPLCRSVIEALHRAVDEMAFAETFRGYGPEKGYRFLIDAIIENDFLPLGVELCPDEVFISDGAKSDTGNIGDILSRGNVVAVTDPVYPVYVDTNVMGGRAGNSESSGRWDRIIYLPMGESNGFVPDLPAGQADVIYLCFPNNPTGAVLSFHELKKWVDYALKHHSLILFDAAYEAFITQEGIPHSIYQIPGAEKCAIEFRSFSKTAGFTGLRCGYTVVPKAVRAFTGRGHEVSLNPLWNRRQSTKFNGTAYIVQRAAEAIYSPEGKVEVRQTIAYYMENARIIRESLSQIGFRVFGGVNAPYIWLKTPEGLSSWEFFDRLLKNCQVVGTPGVGFGPSGEGYLRMTAFGERQSTVQALDRIDKWASREGIRP